MMTLKLNKLTLALRRSIAAALLSAFLIHAATAQPVISPPTWSADSLHAQLTLSNCGDTNLFYVVAASTDLVTWNPIFFTKAVPTNLSVTIPTGSPIHYYRVVGFPPPIYPVFSNAILVASNFAAEGNNIIVDSFNSSEPLHSTAGIYDPTKREANGNIATTSSLMNALDVGNANIYGHVFTGPGTSISSVRIAADGSVGDLNWVSNSTSAIEGGYWSGNYNTPIPDVPAPDTTEWSTVLPSPGTNGITTLNGGNYVVSNGPANLVVSRFTKLWVQSSYSPIGLNMTNAGALVLFVGTNGGSGTTLALRGPSNFPGIAANVQIYGLPSLTNITYTGTKSFAGTIYAPEAAVTLNGSNPDFFIGALVAKSVILIGSANVHFDESLQNAGPSIVNGWLFFWGY